MYFCRILEFSVVSKRNNTCQMLQRGQCPSEVSIFSNFPCLTRNIFVCKFVYIFRTDENPFGSCQPCSNNIHITYDDNTSAHRATCAKDPKQSPRQVPNKKSPHHINSGESGMTTPNHIPDDVDYYAFTAADNSESSSTVQILIEDKFIGKMVDSRASCNLISNEAIQCLFGGRVVSVTPCSKQVSPYLATQALDFVGSWTVNVSVPPNTHKQACRILYCSRTGSNPFRARVIRILRHSYSNLPVRLARVSSPCL